MNPSTYIIIAIGFLAQIFFAARVLVQWIMSERAKKVLSPSLFWILSLAGAYLFCIYGWLKHDFAIILGQFISYYVYLWNLRIKGVFPRIPLLLRIILLITPIVAICFVLGNAKEFIDQFIHNEDVPLGLLIFGSIGQILFTLRFIYQWLYSNREHESKLPAGFWLISLTGSILIVTYGILRFDIVLMVGHSFSILSYLRNLYLLYRERRRTTSSQ